MVCWKNGKEGLCNVLETGWNMKERVGMWTKMAGPVWYVAFGEAAHSPLSASITMDVWGRNPSLGNHPRAFWNYVTWHIEQYRKGEKTIQQSLLLRRHSDTRDLYIRRKTRRLCFQNQWRSASQEGKVSISTVAGNGFCCPISFCISSVWHRL